MLSFWYVSGWFLSVQATNLEAAGVKIQPLKHGVIFVKERYHSHQQRVARCSKLRYGFL
jgi:hypothetical protein